jgi:GntR family transcriptional regulator, vanillate catabolism transcriptional regulator
MQLNLLFCLKVNKMPDQSLEYKVYQQIKDMMLNFDIVPGQRIIITELAENLGVSRTPVKMALIMLSKEGFVNYAPRQSCYTIHQYSREELDRLHDFRVLLERGAVSKSIENLTPADLKELESKASDFEQAANSDKRELRFLLDLNFHACFVDLAGNPYLSETYREVYQRFFMRRRISSFFGDRYASVLAEHEEILEAFRQRDVERAKRTIANHAAATKEFIDSIYF